MNTSMDTSMRVTVDLNQKFFNLNTFTSALKFSSSLTIGSLITGLMIKSLSSHCPGNYQWTCSNELLSVRCFNHMIDAIPCSVNAYKETMGGIFASTAALALLGSAVILYKNRVALLDLRQHLPLANVKLEFIVPEKNVETVQTDLI